MLKARSSRQLLLKCVLYLRWQRWSHSPGLIYLRGRIMNSLWHLIFPSLLIWLSAGIGTGIHTTWVSKLVPLHSQGPTTDLEPLTLRSVIVHGFYIHSKAPQAVKNVTHVVCDTLSQQNTQLCIFFKIHSSPSSLLQFHFCLNPICTACNEWTCSLLSCWNCW